jgi:hypothetical protein
MSEPVKTPEQIAAGIVNQISWSSNVMRNGRLIGEQHVVAEAVAAAIRAERDRCADIPEKRAQVLICGRRRVSQVDQHTAYILKSVADEIRGADHRSPQQES